MLIRGGGDEVLGGGRGQSEDTGVAEWVKGGWRVGVAVVGWTGWKLRRADVYRVYTSRGSDAQYRLRAVKWEAVLVWPSGDPVGALCGVAAGWGLCGSHLAALTSHQHHRGLPNHTRVKGEAM
ncbi:hypothetical protein E2C01_091133 [Portunus trituberculatus]|uniref:Uncharacterized protein n=1 Tax=Portunus trituberculatus TaxID=210409 RepID=A0A5B7JU86_PORTR|nr:hypothetical protein [Portunus trituberculatus]